MAVELYGVFRMAIRVTTILFQNGVMCDASVRRKLRLSTTGKRTVHTFPLDRSHGQNEAFGPRQQMVLQLREALLSRDFHRRLVFRFGESGALREEQQLP